MVFRTGSILVATNECCAGTYNIVGKAIAIVDRKNKDAVLESMTLFKANYNGQHFIIPTSQLRKATPEEKKKNKVNPSYIKPSIINLSTIYWVSCPTPYSSN